MLDLKITMCRHYFWIVKGKTSYKSEYTIYNRFYYFFYLWVLLEKLRIDFGLVTLTDELKNGRRIGFRLHFLLTL